MTVHSGPRARAIPAGFDRLQQLEMDGTMRGGILPPLTRGSEASRERSSPASTSYVSSGWTRRFLASRA
jgi:hypothetical protein